MIMSRKSWVWILAGLWLTGAAFGAGAEAVNVAVRYHCAGGAVLAGNTNLSALNKLLAGRSAGEFEQLALNRVGGLLAKSLQLETNSSTASLVGALLRDVVRNESVGCFSTPASNVFNFVVALHLDAKGAQSWQGNLSRMLGGGGEEFTVERFNGRRWNRGPTDSFWIVPAGDWLVAGRGGDLLPAQTEYLQGVRQHGRPVAALTDNWLEADLDWGRLAVWLPEWSRVLKPAQIHLSVKPDVDKLEWNARVVYEQAIRWESEGWRPPTELVRNPLDSFTAGQDVAAYLNLSPKYALLDGNPLTNQFYAWAMNQMPFQTYMAWPVADASNTLTGLSTSAPAAFNPGLKRFNDSALVWQGAKRRLICTGRRFVAPTLEAEQEKAGQYLLVSFFPLGRHNEPAPEKLWEQIKGRTNLIYYDWELTGPRLAEWRLLGGIMGLREWGRSAEELDARTIDEDWLNGLGAPTGATATEITRPAPNELAMIRKGPIGLTALEMILLSDWLSGGGPGHGEVPAPQGGSPGAGPPPGAR